MNISDAKRIVKTIVSEIVKTLRKWVMRQIDR